MMYDTVIEKLMHHFAGQSFSDEVADAKREFFDRAGILDETSGDFESKMAQFVDWYLFSRPTRRASKTPVAMAMLGTGPALGPDERSMVEGMNNGIHSLFEFLKVKGDDVHVRDVFTGTKHVIKRSPITMGFNRDELFEARLIPVGDSFQFSKGFCFHPPQVVKIIMQEIKRLKKLPPADLEAAKEAMLVRLFKLRYKHEQYKHLDVREVYAPDSKLRI